MMSMKMDTEVGRREVLGGILASAVTLASPWSARAQDEIVIRGSSRFPLALGAFQGASGEVAKRELAKRLEASGYFDLGASSASGVYRVTGGSDGLRVDGALAGPQGQAFFTKRYAENSLVTNVAQLADDIIEAVSGAPGINASRFVFVGRQGGRKELFQCDVDGQRVVALTSDRSISVSPSLDPKGNYIAYTSYASGYPDIYTMDLASRQRRRIVNAPGTNGGAAVSPDGGRIACTMSFSGNKELYVVGRHGGRPRALTRTAASESSPCWSPDGSEIIYCSDQGGRPQLYRIKASGGRPQPLSLGFSYCTEPAWSPDGNRLAFCARSGGIVVVVHDFRSGSTRQLGAGEDPVWGPDSRHLAYTSGGSLYRRNVDTGVVKRLPIRISGISEPSWGR